MDVVMVIRMVHGIGIFHSLVAHQRFLCALKAHFSIQNALLMRIKSAGVLPGNRLNYTDLKNPVAWLEFSSFFSFLIFSVEFACSISEKDILFGPGNKRYGVRGSDRIAWDLSSATGRFTVWIHSSVWIFHSLRTWNNSKYLKIALSRDGLVKEALTCLPLCRRWREPNH